MEKLYTICAKPSILFGYNRGFLAILQHHLFSKCGRFGVRVISRCPCDLGFCLQEYSMDFAVGNLTFTFKTALPLTVDSSEKNTFNHRFSCQWLGDIYCFITAYTAFPLSLDNSIISAALSHQAVIYSYFAA